METDKGDRGTGRGREFGRGPGRPRMRRRCGRVITNTLKPFGVPFLELESIEMSASEAATLRLADLEGKNQEDAAAEMGVSQPTFHRELKEARRKVADALLNRKALTIQADGGETMPNKDGTGPEGKGPRTGRGRGACPAEKDADGNEISAPFWRSGQGLGKGLGRGLGRRMSRR